MFVNDYHQHDSYTYRKYIYILNHKCYFFKLKTQKRKSTVVLRIAMKTNNNGTLKKYILYLLLSI